MCSQSLLVPTLFPENHVPCALTSKSLQTLWNFAVICISFSVGHVCSCACTSALCFYWPTPLEYVVKSQKMLYSTCHFSVQGIIRCLTCSASFHLRCCKIDLKKKKKKKKEVVKMIHMGQHLSLQLLSGWFVVWTQQQPAVCLWLCLAVRCCRS